jgi:hypothetical protein
LARLIAVNDAEKQAVVRCNNSYVWIDTENVDVLKTESVLSINSKTEGWTRDFTADTSAWFELAEAAASNLSVSERNNPANRKLRVPDKVRAVCGDLSKTLTTVEAVHELAASGIDNSPEPLKEWVFKVLEKFPLTAAGFDSNPDNMYFGYSDDVDAMTVSALYCLKPDGSWDVWESEGGFVPTEEPEDPDLLIQLDPDSAEELADHLSDPENAGEPFELSAFNPLEFGLFLAAEAELDFELLDRVFDVYDSYERGINADKQVRGGDGKFTKSAGSGEATRENPKARMKVKLPIVTDPAALIDQYLKEVSEQRGEEQPEPPDPERKSFTTEITISRQGLEWSYFDEFGNIAFQSVPAAPQTGEAEAQPAPGGVIKPLYLAVVDDIDPDAVLDLIALVPPAPGTNQDVASWKRSAGTWVAAPEYVQQLRGSTPPPVIKLDDEAVLTDVIQQVDKATAENVEEAPAPGQTPVDAQGTPESNNPATNENPMAPKPTVAAGEWVFSAADISEHMLETLEELNQFVQKTSLTKEKREEAAKKHEALPDGSFPIKNKEDLKRAIHAYGRAKDKPAAKRHIKKRARALRAEDLLPDDWTDRKSMTARGFAFSDGSLLIRNATELRQAVCDAQGYEQQLHCIKRARALNRIDLIPRSWNVSEASSTDASLWGPYGEIFGMVAAGGWDRNRGNAERLRRYWTRGPGGAKIGWGAPGDWYRCVAHLSKYLGPRAKGYCQLRHKEMNGYYAGDRRNLVK